MDGDCFEYINGEGQPVNYQRDRKQAHTLEHLGHADPRADEEQRLGLEPGSLARLGCFVSRRDGLTKYARSTDFHVVTTPVLDEHGRPAGGIDRATRSDADRHWHGVAERAHLGSLPYIVGDLRQWASTGRWAVVTEGVSAWHIAATCLAPIGITAIGVCSTGPMRNPHLARTLEQRLHCSPHHAAAVIVAAPGRSGHQAARLLKHRLPRGRAHVLTASGGDLTDIHSAHVAHRNDLAAARNSTAAALQTAAHNALAGRPGVIRPEHGSIPTRPQHRETR